MFAAIRSKLSTTPAIVAAWREKKADSGASSPTSTPTTPTEEFETKELETQPAGCGARSKALKWTKVLKNPARLFKSARKNKTTGDAAAELADAAATILAAAVAAAPPPPCRPSPVATANPLPPANDAEASLAALERLCMGGSDDEIRELLWQVGGDVMAEANRKAAEAAKATKAAAAAVAAKNAAAAEVEEDGDDWNNFDSFGAVVGEGKERKAVSQKPSLVKIREQLEEEAEEEEEPEEEEELEDQVEVEVESAEAWRRRIYVPGDIYLNPRPIRRRRIDEPPRKPTIADLEASIAAWRR